MLNRNITLQPSLKHDHVLKHMLLCQNQEKLTTIIDMGKILISMMSLNM